MAQRKQAYQARLGLIETDTLDADLRADYGSYGQMFARYFDALGGRLSYRYYQAQQGELPLRPDECDAYLITGSKAGVYDPLPWIDALSAWIVAFHAAHARLIGICFGHQLIAHSLGGRAGKSPNGWGLGVLASHLCIADTDSLRASLPQLAAVRLIHSHQDQVEALPPGARVLATSEFCRYAVYAIGTEVIGIQGHPEFTGDYFRRLFAGADRSQSAVEVDAALATLAEPTDSEAIGRMLLAGICRAR